MKETRAEIQNLFAHGMTVEEVQAITGMKRASVAQYKANYERRRGRRAQVEQMIHDGAAVNEIVQVTGLSSKTVWRYKQDYLLEGGEYADKQREKTYAWTRPMQIEWVRTVNMIRRACGLKPMDEPEI